MQRASFGPFTVDVTAQTLSRGGDELELRPQAFRALNVLLRNRDRYVHHEQMIREAWDGVTVSPNTVAVTIAEVKKALQEYASWIRCRPKVGYRIEIPRSDDLIKKGWYLWERRTREGLEKALAAFEEAAIEDQTDFRAFEGASLCCLMLCTYGLRPPAEIYPKFLDAYARAVESGGVTAALRANRGHALHICEGNWKDAESELLEAAREDPKRGTTWIRLALLYSSMARLDDALDMMNQARAADPLCPVLFSAESFVRLCRHEFDEALRCGSSSVYLHPYQHVGRAHYAEALERTGRAEEALVQWKLLCTMSPDIPWLRALEGVGLVKNGCRDKALAILVDLERLRQQEYVDAYYMMLLQYALGSHEEALAEWDRARRENSSALFQFTVDIRTEALRNDPAWGVFAGRTWEAHAVAAK